MSVGRICVRDVDLADLEENVRRVAQRMHQRAVGTVVITNDSNVPVGIISDRDLVQRVMSEGRDPETTLVRDVMTPEPCTVGEDVPIEQALSMMREGRFRRLPVVDQMRRLVGLLSLDDVLMLLAEEFTQIGQLLEQETPRVLAQ